MGLATEDETGWHRSKGETKLVNHASWPQEPIVWPRGHGIVLFAQCFPR